MVLQCNTISHWLGAYTEWSLLRWFNLFHWYFYCEYNQATHDARILVRAEYQYFCFSNIHSCGLLKPEHNGEYFQGFFKHILLNENPFYLDTNYYIDVIMTTMASQITSPMVVYSIVYSGVDQRRHQSSASPAFVLGIHRDRWIPPRTKGQ